MQLNILQYCSCCVTLHGCQRVVTGGSYVFHFGIYHDVPMVVEVTYPGADPGFRRGGGFVHSEGGGGGVRTGISGADPNCCRALGKSTSKTNCRQPWGGGGVRSPQKKPVSAPGTHPFIRSLPSIVVVDCAINQWAVWGVCLRSGQTCGFKYGLQVRTRQVIQLPSPNGQKCPVTTETRRCRMKFRSCVGVCLPFL